MERTHMPETVVVALAGIFSSLLTFIVNILMANVRKRRERANAALVEAEAANKAADTMSDVSAAMQSHLKAYDEMFHALRSRDQIIGSLNQQLIDTQTEIKRQKVALEELEAIFKTSCDSYRCELENLRKELRERDEKIAAVQSKAESDLKARDTVIGELQSESARKDSKITEQQGEIQRLEKRTATLESQVKDLENKLAEKEKHEPSNQ
jgi:chromosome segregation ATPase